MGDGCRGPLPEWEGVTPLSKRFRRQHGWLVNLATFLADTETDACVQAQGYTVPRCAGRAVLTAS